MEELQFKEEIEEWHNNMIVPANYSKHDTKNYSSSANIIEEHFSQVGGTNRKQCSHLMKEHTVPKENPQWMDRGH